MNSNSKINGKRVQITRDFAAPPCRVFQWWTTAEKLRQWSGCAEAVRCDVEMDFRVGGSFIQTMQIADICEFTVTGKYLDIVEPELIVYDGMFGDAPVRVTVEFSESTVGTRVVLTYDGCPDDFFCANVSRGTEESFLMLGTLVLLRRDPKEGS